MSILSCIKLQGLVPLLVRNGARRVLYRRLKGLALRHLALPKTGVDIIWQRSNILNLNPSLRTHMIDPGSLSGLLLRGR